jgi:hypothetical protein
LAADLRNREEEVEVKEIGNKVRYADVDTNADSDLDVNVEDWDCD